MGGILIKQGKVDEHRVAISLTGNPITELGYLLYYNSLFI